MQQFFIQEYLVTAIIASIITSVDGVVTTVAQVVGSPLGLA